MRVDIIDGKRSTFRYREDISNLGFWYVKNKQIDGRWTKECDEVELPKIKKFCRKRKLEYAVYEDGYMRSSNYRTNYFKIHPGLFNNFYRCAYCGKICTKKDITVDHLIPVDKVIKGKTRKQYIRYLNRHGISNVNDVRNLVAACKSCNSKKSTNTGLWVFRGMVGRHSVFWMVYHFFLLTISIFIISNFTEIIDFFRQLLIEWLS